MCITDDSVTGWLIDGAHRKEIQDGMVIVDHFDGLHGHELTRSCLKRLVDREDSLGNLAGADVDALAATLGIDDPGRWDAILQSGAEPAVDAAAFGAPLEDELAALPARQERP